MNTRTQQLIDEEILRTGGNISKVARALGLGYHGVRARLVQSMINQKRGCSPAVGPEPEDIRTLGRPGFESYVIAIKRQGGHWPDHYADAIAAARRKFDDGTHEMFQTPHADGWVVQYLIPRLKVVPRRRFFASLQEFGV